MKKKTVLAGKRLSKDGFLGAIKRPIVLVLDNIRSGHNVGAAFRLSDAFLLKHLYLCGITPIPPHPQIEKTALGAAEVVSWSYAADTSTLIADLRTQGYTIVGVELTEEAIKLDTWAAHNITEPLALVFGHEVFGIKQDVLEQIDLCVEIPQYGTKLSMNVAMCMGIVVWELVRKPQ